MQLSTRHRAEGASLNLLIRHVAEDFEATKRAYRIAWALSGLPVIAQDRRNGRYLCAVASDAEPPTGWKRVGCGHGLLIPVEVSTKLELFSLRGPSLQRLTVNLFPQALAGESCQYGQDSTGTWYLWGKPQWGPPVE